ncbi:unnamed protein product [Porites evermanni]|uniref:Uncharacterized protein n=1 Tax=Porites evermanni TaxID=104178 RepID=A0ABN8MDN7_9CNID|nr:unnamed protein product [Porites evermanni]
MKSDEEIACELFLSPRTVMRICHKFVMTGSVLADKDGRPVGTTTLHQHEEYILLEAIVREIAAQRRDDLRAQFRADMQNHRPH